MKNVLKIMLFSMLFVWFGIGVSAQTTLENPTIYCESSLSQYSSVDRLLVLGITPEQVSNQEGCVCFNSQTQYSDWRNKYCNNQALLQERDAYTLSSPLCVNWEKTTESQSVVDERCLTCPSPKVLSDWGLVGCYSMGRIESRRVVASMFSEVPGKGCYEFTMNELRNVPGSCSVNDVINSYDFWLNGLGSFIIVFAIILLFIKRKEVFK